MTKHEAAHTYVYYCSPANVFFNSLFYSTGLSFPDPKKPRTLHGALVMKGNVSH